MSKINYDKLKNLKILLEKCQTICTKVEQFNMLSLSIDLTSQMIENPYEESKNIKVEDVNFSIRTGNFLSQYGIKYNDSIERISELSEPELLNIRGLGKKSLLEIQSKLSEHGYCLKGSYFRGKDNLDEMLISVETQLRLIRNLLVNV